MGWDGNSLWDFGNMKDYMKKNYNWSNEFSTSKLLDYAVVNRQTVYAAIETTDRFGVRTVWADVILFRFTRTDYMKKDIEESMGPGEDDCPLRILKLLTPTTKEYALDWRKRCYERIALSKFKMKAGAVFVHKAKPSDTVTLICPYVRTQWKCNYSGDYTTYRVSKRKLIKQGYTTPELLFAAKL